MGRTYGRIATLFNVAYRRAVTPKGIAVISSVKRVESQLERVGFVACGALGSIEAFM